jgi:hypothetical protein
MMGALSSKQNDAQVLINSERLITAICTDVKVARRNQIFDVFPIDIVLQIFESLDLKEILGLRILSQIGVP